MKRQPLTRALWLAAGFVAASQMAWAVNSFYNASGAPAQGSALSSATMRTEFASIGAGFDKLPALTANTAIVVNSSGTALTNTVGTLALAGNFATTGAFNTTFIQQASTSLTLPLTTDTIVGRATTDTLTNKTLSGASNTFTNIPISTAISGLGTGVATFVATPSSANLLAALTTKTGTGNAVFSTSPTLTGIAQAAVLSVNNGAGLGNAVLESAAGNSGGAAVGGFFNGASGQAFYARVDITSANLVQFLFSTIQVGTITTNGSTTSYNTSSDQRLKNNIVDAGDPGPIIDALRVRQWDWKSDGSHEAFGLVAQEEVTAAPFAVTQGDADPNTITKQWQRDDSKLVPLLVKEIQSLRARVAALEAR